MLLSFQPWKKARCCFSGRLGVSGIKPSLDCHARKRKKNPIGSYYTADFYFEVTQNAHLSEHYSFRD